MSRQEPVKKQIPSQPQLFSLSKSIASACNQWASLKSQIKYSQIWKQLNARSKKFSMEICKPITLLTKNLYNDFPQQITNLKFSCIQNYTFKERFLLLNLIVGSYAIFSLTRPLSFWHKTLRTVRNTTVVYLLSGLLMTPEIYNPLVKQ